MKFGGIIEGRWDGIAAHCAVEHKVDLGFVEGLNNKLRVIRRRTRSLRDADYLCPKVLTCILTRL